MNLKVRKSTLNGRVLIPGSKSHTIRAITAASLAEGISYIRNPLISSDALSAVECFKKMGANIDTTNPKSWKIEGVNGKLLCPDETINVGNSGTTLRLAVGAAGLIDKGKTIRFTGDEQIQSRPISPLLESLNDLGAKAVSLNDGKAPVEISGKLCGGKTSIECFTSQYLSSLLMTSPLAEGNTEINVTLLNEPDYVGITLDWLDMQHIRYEKSSDMMHYTVYGGQKYTSFDKIIPADFSSATFFMCAGAALDAEIVLEGLDFSDRQPDKAVFQYLKDMGADITLENKNVYIKKSQLQGIDIDMNRTPDALPAMAAMACLAKGTTRLLNVPQARKKETDRIACMAKELKKFGANVDELPDGLIIYDSGRLSPTNVNGHGDHRIVMALSVLAMALDGNTNISTAEAISVTFPDYVKLMTSIGADMNMTD